MSFGSRNLAGAALPRSQQLIIFVLGLGLAVLLAWRAGLLWRPSPASSPPPPRYFIQVQGDLPRAGVHVFFAPPTVQEVYEAAGGRGTLPEARSRLKSGAKITFLPDLTINLTRMSGPDLLTLGLALDPNQATAEDLAAIPGLGPVLARRLVEFREAHGPFTGLDDLLAVKGMGPKILEKIRPFMVIIGFTEKIPDDVKETPPWNRNIPPLTIPKP